MAHMVIGAAGSFAAIAALLGSPLAGAFLLMEAAGLGGPIMGVVLVPGLLAAVVGALIYVGLDAWTGFGTFPRWRSPICPRSALRPVPSSCGRSRSACSPPRLVRRSPGWRWSCNGSSNDACWC